VGRHRGHRPAPLALRGDAEATGTEIELGDRATVRLALTVTAKAGTTPSWT